MLISVFTLTTFCERVWFCDSKSDLVSCVDVGTGGCPNFIAARAVCPTCDSVSHHNNDHRDETVVSCGFGSVAARVRFNSVYALSWVHEGH